MRVVEVIKGEMKGDEVVDEIKEIEVRVGKRKVNEKDKKGLIIKNEGSD